MYKFLTWFGFSGIPSRTSARISRCGDFSLTQVMLVPQIEVSMKLLEEDHRSKLLGIAGFKVGSGNKET